mgnify:CR=1 FL=1
MNALVQGTPEWHAHRASRLNASEAGAVMGANPWFPRSPADLYDLKTGAKSVDENPAMRRGTEMEPIARAAAESVTAEQFTPVVKEKGRYSASLDGENFEASVALEVKCPMSPDSKLFSVLDAESLKAVAPHYWWQLVHQQYVAGFQLVHFCAYHPEVGAHVISISADQLVADRDALIEAWEKFAACLDSGERPESDEADDDSEEMEALVTGYRAAKAAADEAAEALKAADKALKDRAKASGLRKLCGFGLTVTRSERQGAIDYKKVPELEGVDLENYRKKSSVVYSIRD